MVLPFSLLLNSATKYYAQAHYLVRPVILRRIGAGMDDPLSACSIIKKRSTGKSPSISGLREAAINHQRYMNGATTYPLEKNTGNGMLCIVPDI